MSRLAYKHSRSFFMALTGLLLCAVAGPVFTPQPIVGAVSNGRIAYAGEDGDGNMQIYTSDADGSNIQQLTHDSGGDDSFPAWSPDGTKIAYMTYTGASDQIFVMNADGSNQTALTTDTTTTNATPAWSPDGTKIAYTSEPADFSAQATVNVMNADGSGIAALTDGTSQSGLPTWSPDGSKLAFICLDGGSIEQVCTMHNDGSNVQQITSGTTTNYTSVAYSPSDPVLAYTTESNGGGYIEDLGTMNDDGTGQQNIADSNNSNIYVTWSPDSSKLLYNNYDNTAGLLRVYYINLDGSGETVVTPSNQYTQTSSWQPISDADGDGITSTVEDTAPNGGDANGDGTADKTQANVTSLVDPVTGSYVTVQSSCTSNAAVSAQALPASYIDPAFHYPAGLIGFTLTCATPGTTATITQYFYGIAPLNTMVLRKYNSGTHTYTTIPGTTVSAATIGGQLATKVRYQVTDGGVFDADGAANGTIVDPVGLATPAVGTPNTGANGSVIFPRSLDAPLL